MIIINRLNNNGNNIVGELIVNDQKFCDTLELSWINNEQNISCIPSGIYTIERYSSIKFIECFSFKNVTNRSDILIHNGNYASSSSLFKTDTEGCVLVGTGIQNNDYPEQRMILNSDKTLYALMKILPEQNYELTITCLY